MLIDIRRLWLSKETEYSIPTLLLCITINLLSIPWWAYAISVLWAWFFVPYGLPELTLVAAAGLRLFVGFISYNSTIARQDSDAVAQTIASVVGPALALGVGWVLKTVL